MSKIIPDGNNKIVLAAIHGLQTPREFCLAFQDMYPFLSGDSYYSDFQQAMLEAACRLSSGEEGP